MYVSAMRLIQTCVLQYSGWNQSRQPARNYHTCSQGVRLVHAHSFSQWKKYKYINDLHFLSIFEGTCHLQYAHTYTTSYLNCILQMIHAREMLPCQDTPSVKSTFSAKVYIIYTYIIMCVLLLQQSTRAVIHRK